MEIKKADSKGRVTGFTPGKHYVLDHSQDGVITLRMTAVLHEGEWVIPLGKGVESD